MADDQVNITLGIAIGGAEQAKAAIASIRVPIDNLISGFRELGEAIGAAFGAAKIGDLAKEMAQLGERMRDLAAAIGTTPEKLAPFSSPMRLAGGSATEAREKEKAIRAEAELFAAGERLKLAEAQGSMAKIAAVYSEWLAEVAAIYGQNSVQYLDLEREKIVATQRAAASQAAAEKRAAEEAKAYWDKIRRHLDEMGRDAQRRLDATWNKIAGPVEHNISDALTDAVLGIRQRGGIGRVELDIGKSLVGGVMNNLVKGIGDSLFKPLFTSLFPQGGFLGGLGNLLFGTGSEATKISLLSTIAANTTAIAGFTGTTAASTGTSAVGTGFGAIGAFSGIRSFFGWVGGLFGFAQGGIVPSAAGGWSLPSFVGATPALLHSQEMVLPADLSQGLQNMIRSGGAGDVHVHLGFYGPTDGASIGRWFGQNRGDLAQAIRGAWDSGALSFP